MASGSADTSMFVAVALRSRQGGDAGDISCGSFGDWIARTESSLITTFLAIGMALGVCENEDDSSGPLLARIRDGVDDL